MPTAKEKNSNKVRNNFTLNKTFDKLHKPFPLPPECPCGPASNTPFLRAHAKPCSCARGWTCSGAELWPRSHHGRNCPCTRCADRSQPNGIPVTHAVIQTNWVTTTPPSLCIKSWGQGVVEPLRRREGRL